MQHKRFERLLLFAEVAEQKSFTRAAEQLGVSKGHLSDQIKKLEQEYATPLLVRTTRSIRLTSEGYKALDSCKEIKYLLNNFEQNLQKLDGTIRITAPKLFAERFLTSIISKFNQIHPSITFEINTSYTRFDLNQAHFDMAFRASNQPPPDNMIAKKLFDYHHVVVASPAYLKAHQKPEFPEELKVAQCLTAEATSQWQFSTGPVELVGKIATNDNQLLRQLALEHQGITRLPGYYLQDDIRRGDLIPLFNKFCVTGYAIFLLYPTATRESSRLNQFISFVVQEVKQQMEEVDK